MNVRFGLVYRLALAISTAGIVLSLSAMPACGGQASGASQAPEDKPPEAKSKASEAKKTPREIASAAAAPGIGGMALISADMYVVVHDTKAGKKSPRVGLLGVGRKPSYREIDVDWTKAGGEGNDIEAIAPIPGRKHEYMACESGYFEGKYGRLIHIQLENVDDPAKTRAVALGAWQLPKDTDNVEGLVCREESNGKLLVVLGERGGKVVDGRSGKLRWCELDLAKYGTLAVEASHELSIALPGGAGWADRETVRGCGDLYLDDAGRIWSAATEDPGDDGPFRSVLFVAAELRSDEATLRRIDASAGPIRVFDGLKVEAISPAPQDRGDLAVATDDENYGAAWRPVALPKPVAKTKM